jgi:predicted enzyme related to lactoylglutathione lyase
MDTYNPVGWFEIPVTDLDRAEAFYNALFGITLARQPEENGFTMSWFPWHEGAKGAAGALVFGTGYVPAPEGQGVVLYFTTEDLEASLARTTEAGGMVIVPVTDIGEYGMFARIQDTEGNHLCLHTARRETSPAAS